MGKDDRDRKRRRNRRSRKRSETSSSSSLSPSSYDTDSESPEEKRRRSRRSHKSNRRRDKSRHRLRNEDTRRSSRKRKRKQRKRSPSSASGNDSSSPGGDSPDLRAMEPEGVIRLILEKFPDVAHDLEQLLQLIDSGQGVDIKGIPDKSLVRVLKKLFSSLHMVQNEKGVFLLPSTGMPTLNVIGSTLSSHMKSREDCADFGSLKKQQCSLSCPESTETQHLSNSVLVEKDEKEDSLVPPKRIIGPEMPSRELLAAAAELTKAEAELRDADLEADNGLFIGPPPPAMVAEAETANEAERFEEVTRILSAEVAEPYDVLGVNWKASFDIIKKKYWKISLLVHPDKCSHPQAHQAFVILNQAFKYLQDPEKRKATDGKMKVKEEQEAFKVELQSLREAAQWRRLQGIAIEGDDELLSVPREEPNAKRDEWMTELPPERKPGMPVQSTSFSKFGKEGRGDTSMWTDTPLDKSRKAKQNYLEAYNKAKELADIDAHKQSTDSNNTDLVDKYNSKRSKSLVQKLHEESKHRKKKSKDKLKEEWVDSHPWKPWDRENDLAAGRQKVNLDAENMAQGLSSRFSSGSVQRNFL